MNFKNVRRILRTPGCWIRNCRTNAAVDAFYREVINRKNEVKVVKFPDIYGGEPGYAFFELNGFRYRTWVNGWDASLCQTAWSTAEDPGYYLGFIDGRMPSRTTLFDFMEAFAPKKVTRSKKDTQCKELLKTLPPKGDQS